MLINYIKFYFCILLITVFITFNCEPQSSDKVYKNILFDNKNRFVKIAEKFFNQNQIFDIEKYNRNKFMINGKKIKLVYNKNGIKNEKVRHNNINVILNDENTKITNIEKWIKDNYNISTEEFLAFLEFLKDYDLHTLYKANDAVFIAFHLGFLSESTGLFYIPKNHEKFVKNYYPTKPEYLSRVIKITDRWFYYSD
jgi:hypothetical protein